MGPWADQCILLRKLQKRKWIVLKEMLQSVQISRIHWDLHFFQLSSFIYRVWKMAFALCFPNFFTHISSITTFVADCFFLFLRTLALYWSKLFLRLFCSLVTCPTENWFSFVSHKSSCRLWFGPMTCSPSAPILPQLLQTFTFVSISWYSTFQLLNVVFMLTDILNHYNAKASRYKQISLEVPMTLPKRRDVPIRSHCPPNSYLHVYRNSMQISSFSPIHDKIPLLGWAPSSSNVSSTLLHFLSVRLCHRKRFAIQLLFEILYAA